MRGPRCRQENSVGARFCNACGARLAVACPACGHANVADSRFCNACGQRLDAAEDLHWIDSQTQALLDGLVDSLPTARLLLLVNYRPEDQHGWGSLYARTGRRQQAQLHLATAAAMFRDMDMRFWLNQAEEA